MQHAQGKSGTDVIKLEASLLLAAQQELKGKAQMAKDLEMVGICTFAATAVLGSCVTQKENT